MSYIIRSLLENDFYAFTMAQLAFHQQPDVEVKYRFKCRNNWAGFHKVNTLNKNFEIQFEKQLKHLCKLTFTDGEIEFLRRTGFFKEDFLRFLKHFMLRRSDIEYRVINNNLELTIKGKWLNTIWFESPVLAIISQLFRNPDHIILLENKLIEKTVEKINWLKLNGNVGFTFSDFGLRRRLSANSHDNIIELTKEKASNLLSGTSNCYLAYKYGLKPIGTMAHQLFMIYQRVKGPGFDRVDPALSVVSALEAWYKEYNGKLSIALTDIFGFDNFLENFALRNNTDYYYKLFAGCRHDSADPYMWCDKLIRFYSNRHIDPMTKTAVFSDGLTFKKAMYLHLAFHRRIKTGFGIGTNYTNDIEGVPSIVIKPIEVNGLSVAKLADDSGKGMCEDPDYVDYVRYVCNLKEKN